MPRSSASRPKPVVSPGTRNALRSLWRAPRNARIASKSHGIPPRVRARLATPRSSTKFDPARRFRSPEYRAIDAGLILWRKSSRLASRNSSDVRAASSAVVPQGRREVAQGEEQQPPIARVLNLVEAVQQGLRHILRPELRQHLVDTESVLVPRRPVDPSDQDPHRLGAPAGVDQDLGPRRGVGQKRLQGALEVLAFARHGGGGGWRLDPSGVSSSRKYPVSQAGAVVRASQGARDRP